MRSLPSLYWWTNDSFTISCWCCHWLCWCTASFVTNPVTLTHIAKLRKLPHTKQPQYNLTQHQKKQYTTDLHTSSHHIPYISVVSCMYDATISPFKRFHFLWIWFRFYTWVLIKNHRVDCIIMLQGRGTTLWHSDHAELHKGHSALTAWIYWGTQDAQDNHSTACTAYTVVHRMHRMTTVLHVLPYILAGIHRMHRITTVPHVLHVLRYTG